MDIVNEEGGIGGKKIKLIIEDGQWKSDVAMALLPENYVHSESFGFFRSEYRTGQSDRSRFQEPLQDACGFTDHRFCNRFLTCRDL